jgi:hypothetical protein
MVRHRARVLQEVIGAHLRSRSIRVIAAGRVNIENLPPYRYHRKEVAEVQCHRLRPRHLCMRADDQRLIFSSLHRRSTKWESNLQLPVSLLVSHRHGLGFKLLFRRDFDANRRMPVGLEVNEAVLSSIP